MKASLFYLHIASLFSSLPGAFAFQTTSCTNCKTSWNIQFRSIELNERKATILDAVAKNARSSGNKGNAKDISDMEKAVRSFKLLEERKEKKKDRKQEKREISAKIAEGASRQGRGIKANPLRPIRSNDTLPSKNSQVKMINPFALESKISSKFNVVDLTGIEFLGSFAEDESQWPTTKLPEVAFLGRSNVGKSSMLNCLFGEKVAKVSKTPGRTQLINIFSAYGKGGKEVCRLADLPGYGYAKLAKEDQRSIEGFLFQYLKHRIQLKLLVLLVDCRRDPLVSDAEILEFASQVGVHFKVLVVATKIDKLSELQATMSLMKIREGFELPDELPIAFSAITGKGRKEVLQYIREACMLDMT